MGLLYRPGDGLLIVGPAALILVQGRTPDAIGADQIGELFDIVKSGRPLMHALDILVRDGFRAMAPSLLAESVDGVLRVIVHGDVAVEVATADGQTRNLTSRGVATLAESVLDDAIAVRVGSDSSVPSLPLGAGAVCASSFEWTLDNDPVPTWPAAERAAVPPVPAVSGGAGAWYTASGPPEPEIGDFVGAVGVMPPVGAAPASKRARPGEATREVPAVQPGPRATDTAATFIGDLEESGYDHLWESTVMRSVEDAAIRPAPDEVNDTEVSAPTPVRQPLTAVPDFRKPPPTAAQAVSTQLGDHDGSTIMDSSLGRRLRESRSSAGGPVQLRISTGQVVVFERTVVVGRQPSVSRVSVQDMPTLVVVPSRQMDISRNHLEVRRSGEQVIAVDLQSTNGSTIFRLDGSSQQLERGGQLPVNIGDVIDLGDSVTVTVEASP